MNAENVLVSIDHFKSEKSKVEIMDTIHSDHVTHLTYQVIT